MIPDCARCDGAITTDNRRWPGYCSAACASAARQDRDARRDRAREKRHHTAVAGDR